MQNHRIVCINNDKLMLMNYEDFYDESKGRYYSFESMTFLEKISYISLNLWYFINIIFIGFLVYKIVIEIAVRIFSIKNFKH